MIYTITLNPSIDYFLKLDETLSNTEINRTNEYILKAGGKGINVSKVLNTLEISSNAIVVLKGFTGDYIENELKNYRYISTCRVNGNIDSRINVKLFDKNSKYAINTSGSSISNLAKDEIKNIFNRIKEDDYILLCGSRIEGICDDFIIEMSNIINSKKAKFIIDMEDLSFNLLKSCKPYLIKPNLFELEAILGHKLNSFDEIKNAANLLIENGVENALVSLDKKGGMFKNKDSNLIIKHTKVHNVNDVGTGDAMLGVFIGFKHQGYNYEEALKWGAAAGSATAASVNEISIEDIKKELLNIKIKR